MHTLWLYDKDRWKKGPWQDEPDYVAWIDEDTLYRCVARRNEFGVWCGFVGVMEDHPLFMAQRTDVAFRYVDIHGSVTITEFCDEPDVLFVPPKRSWWVGFDCMHDCDVLPPFSDPKTAPKVLPRQEEEDTTDRFPAVYRDIEYVRNEVGFLAMQLAFFEDAEQWNV